MFPPSSAQAFHRSRRTFLSRPRLAPLTALNRSGSSRCRAQTLHRGPAAPPRVLREVSREPVVLGARPSGRGIQSLLHGEGVMTNWIYCGTDPPVAAPGTQQLLQTRQAIWSPPPQYRPPWPGMPRPGERLWLVWRPGGAETPIRLLGGGRIERAPRDLFHTSILWTNPDDPGLRDAARELGYGGPSNMSFLRLVKTVLPHGGGQPLVQGLEAIGSRLTVATPAQIRLLGAALRIR